MTLQKKLAGGSDPPIMGQFNDGDSEQSSE
jgi:hypothetical protein